MNAAVGKDAPRWLCIEAMCYSCKDTSEYATGKAEHQVPQVPQGYLSVPEAMRAAGIASDTTIKNYINAGRLKAITIKGGGRVRYVNLDDVLRCRDESACRRSHPKSGKG